MPKGRKKKHRHGPPRRHGESGRKPRSKLVIVLAAVAIVTYSATWILRRYYSPLLIAILAIVLVAVVFQIFLYRLRLPKPSEPSPEETSPGETALDTKARHTQGPKPGPL